MKLNKVLSMLFIIVILISLKPSICVFAGSEESVDHTEEFYLPYHTGYTLLKNGRLKSFADEKRIISENPCQIYHPSINNFAYRSHYI